MLTVENLEAGYGGLPVLKGVSMSIGRNESVALIGANGAGKSTLVRAICGLDTASPWCWKTDISSAN
jgi:branched-chain amino acid transport system ATP-binding protein